jgi:glucokinase
LETYLGNNYIIENVKETIKNSDSKILELIENNPENISPRVVHEASLLGDEFSKQVIAELGEKLGCGLASIVNVLDISNIIIGGGVSGFGKPLFDATKTTIKSRVLKSLKPRVKVLQARLKNNAGIKGASSLVFYS